MSIFLDKGIIVNFLRCGNGVVVMKETFLIFGDTCWDLRVTCHDVLLVCVWGRGDIMLVYECPNTYVDIYIYIYTHK